MLEILAQLSPRLLALHKLLLDRQRAEYEAVHGRIGSTGEYLNLVLNHARFEWLRQLSGLIVEIDEILAPRSKYGPDEPAGAISQTRSLLTPSETGSEFQRNYWLAIQESPDVVLLHREIVSLL